MAHQTKRLSLVALFLGAVFLATQLHCCVDLNSATMDSHICPICSTTGTALASPALIMALVPAINRLELFGVMALVSVVILCNVAPRAPPAS
jgi:hypothetical protein